MVTRPRRKPVWCVMGLDGWWCATRAQKNKPATHDSSATLCMHVTLPYGVMKRRPTCPGCRERLMRREDRKAAKADRGYQPPEE